MLYTTGYEGIDIDRFIKMLKCFKISTVVDVRKLALSRKKDFCKNALSSKLMSCNIEYLNLNNLGTPEHLRAELNRTRNYVTFFREYKKYMKKNPDELKTIKTLIDKGNNVVLLCLEKDDEKCHRKIIAEEIKKMDGNGLEIIALRY